jgi:hypothetical protein
MKALATVLGLMLGLVSAVVDVAVIGALLNWWSL